MHVCVRHVECVCCGGVCEYEHVCARVRVVVSQVASTCYVASSSVYELPCSVHPALQCTPCRV